MSSGEARLMITDDRKIVIVGRKHRSKWWTIWCSCPKSRRRKDGTCKHQHQVYQLLKSDIAARTKMVNRSGERI